MERTVNDASLAAGIMEMADVKRFLKSRMVDIRHDVYCTKHPWTFEYLEE